MNGHGIGENRGRVKIEKSEWTVKKGGHTLRSKHTDGSVETSNGRLTHGAKKGLQFLGVSPLPFSWLTLQ